MNEFAKFMQKVESLAESRELSLTELEKRAGLGHAYFTKIRQRQAMPTIAKVDVIAEFFGVSRDFLIGTESPTGTGVKIPLLGRVAAGIPIEATENLIGEEEITQKLASTGEFFALLIKGDSMSPDIQNGDKVIVKQQEDAESGQIAIVLINGNDAVCKELKKSENGIALISRNPSYAPMYFSSDEVANKPVRIIGQVIEVRRTL